MHFTHENITAGVAAVRAVLPLSNLLSSLDTVISAFPLSSPYGRAIAYTALFEAASFATVKSTGIFVTADGESIRVWNTFCCT